jgi:hypothetical protein
MGAQPNSQSNASHERELLMMTPCDHEHCTFTVLFFLKPHQTKTVKHRKNIFFLKNKNNNKRMRSTSGFSRHACCARKACNQGLSVVLFFNKKNTRELDCCGKTNSTFFVFVTKQNFHSGGGGLQKKI